MNRTKNALEAAPRTPVNRGWMPWTGLRRLIGVVLGAISLVAAVASPAGAGQPKGWRVKVSHQPLLAKQSIYGFTVTVRDATGERVDDAVVSLRVPGFRADEPIRVPARRVGKGRYFAKAHLPMADTARYVQADVEPAGMR